MNLLSTTVTFLLWTVLFWAASSAVSRIFWIVTQHGQLLGGWQNKLRKWDIGGTKWGQFMAKIGGYCELCYCHAWGVIAFVFYVLWMNTSVGLWMPGFPNYLIVKILLNIVWGVMFIHLSTVINLYQIKKMLTNGN